MKTYQPKPIDTSDIVLPPVLTELTERLAENVHDVWALARINEGWSYGESRSDSKKQTPCLVPYSELTPQEQDYDRQTAIQTLKIILKLGFKIS